jgi:hypothetical protein
VLLTSSRLEEVAAATPEVWAGIADDLVGAVSDRLWCARQSEQQRRVGGKALIPPERQLKPVTNRERVDLRHPYREPATIPNANRLNDEIQRVRRSRNDFDSRVPIAHQGRSIDFADRKSRDRVAGTQCETACMDEPYNKD